MESSGRKGQTPTFAEKIESTIAGAWESLVAAYFGLGFVFAWIVGIVTFFGSWIYCINEYGYLLGVGLGWLPSIIVAPIAAFLAYFLWAFLPLIGFFVWLIWYL